MRKVTKASLLLCCDDFVHPATLQICFAFCLVETTVLSFLTCKSSQNVSDLGFRTVENGWLAFLKLRLSVCHFWFEKEGFSTPLFSHLRQDAYSTLSEKLKNLNLNKHNDRELRFLSDARGVRRMSNRGNLAATTGEEELANIRFFGGAFSIVA